MVYAPFSLAVARLHFIARLALAHLSALVGGRAGLAARPFIYNVLWLNRSHAASRKTRAARLYRRQADLQRLTACCARLRSACSGLSRLRRLRLPALAALRHIVSKSEPLQVYVHSLRRKTTRKTHSLRS